MGKKYFDHVIKTKGLLGAFARSKQIIQRFGFTSKKIEQCLDTFIEMTEGYGYKPTLCITAILLNRYPELIKKLNNKKMELAFHGYYHTDYRLLPEEVIATHFTKAKEIFERSETPIFGFRFPYLSWDDHVLQSVKKEDFLWSSNQIICWDVLDKNRILKERWENFQRVIKRLYIKTRDSITYPSLPRDENGLIEIPISVPDDEIIIDRLGITDREEIHKIWQKMLEMSHQRGELFTLQTHHERMFIYKEALQSLLEDVKNLGPNIWVAPLKDIAQWWKEKKGFSFHITEHEKGNYHIEAHCSDRATILVKKPAPGNPSGSLFDHYAVLQEKNFNCTCNKKPIIGVSDSCHPKLTNFLREEGFVVESGSSKDDYALFLNNCDNFCAGNERELIDTIECTPFPLIRFWRWPDNARSAFAITGDIDCITIFDFVRRYVQF